MASERNTTGTTPSRFWLLFWLAAWFGTLIIVGVLGR